MNPYPEIPDNWIERQPEDCPPNPDEFCIVCGKLDCECEGEDLQ